MSEQATDESPRLSRAEIETLCLLQAIGSGSSLSGVAHSLGLSPHLGRAIGQALQALVATGFVVVDADRVTPTENGLRHLRERLDLWLSPNP